MAGRKTGEARQKRFTSQKANKSKLLIQGFQKELDALKKRNPNRRGALYHRRGNYLKNRILREKNSPTYHASQFEKQSKNVEKSNPNYGKGGKHEKSNQAASKKPNTTFKNTASGNGGVKTNTTFKNTASGNGGVKSKPIKGKGPVRDPKTYTKTVKEHSAKKEAEARKKWEKSSRNSPARKSGAFTDDELWAKRKKHQEWKEARKKKGGLKEWEKKYKKGGLKIPSVMDME